MKADVLIVGGGVSGSSLAYLLSKKGFNVIIAEKKPKVGYPHHCSGILGFDAIKELVHFSEDWVISDINWARFTSPGGITLEIRKPLAKVVDRGTMDRELWDLALSEGALGLLSSPFKGLVSKDEAIMRGRIIQFDVLVGADGSLSRVAEAMGFRKLKVEIGIHRLLEGGSLDGYIVKVMRGSRFAWIQPWKGGRKVGALGGFNDPVLLWTRHLTSEPSMGYEGGLIPAEIRRRFVRGRIALIGDAAGQIKPLSRGGVLFSSRSAYILAESLSDEFEDPSRALKRYEFLWWKSQRREVVLGRGIRRFLDKLTSKKIDRIFSLLKEEEDLLEKEFHVDRQSAPLFALPAVKVLKLATEDIVATISAAAEILRYIIR